MLLDHHRAKLIDDPEHLCALLGPRPRDRAVVMCHGVFDVVHPGHLRHLLYAKSKAPVLVCSVTGDAHTSKGPYRPHVPQELRAANLAMLDIVDYVIVGAAPDPAALITRLQPDYYAKGFEYDASRHAQPIMEAALVAAYGGEVLFTPGDVVYSSSELIAGAAPDLRWDKLALVMRRAGVTFDDLRSVVRAMRGCRLHVVGDTIVDALVHCEMIGTSGKTPTLSVRRARREEFVGGAGIVARHARAAGAEVGLTTVIGDDAAGLLAVTDAEGAGIDVGAIVDRARPTTVKEVVVVDGYRLLKIDTVDSRSISDALVERLRERIAEPRWGGTIFADFRHGIFNARTIPRLADAIPAGCLRAADSQVASRWGNICEFSGFDLVTPNEREARFALADQDSGVRSLAAALHERMACRGLILKLGARGVLGFGEWAGASFALDSFAGDVVDAVGAGDALLAYAALALLVRPSLPIAAILGSMAAAAECAYDGNRPVAPEAVLAKIAEAEREVG